MAQGTLCLAVAASYESETMTLEARIKHSTAHPWSVRGGGHAVGSRESRPASRGGGRWGLVMGPTWGDLGRVCRGCSCAEPGASVSEFALRAFVLQALVTFLCISLWTFNVVMSFFHTCRYIEYLTSLSMRLWYFFIKDL